MNNTRIKVHDTVKNHSRAFMEGARVLSSSAGAPWDDTILVERLALPPGELLDCWSGGYTISQHLTLCRIERLNDNHQLEGLTVGPDMVQFDPPRVPLGARWSVPQEILIIIPHEATIQRTLLEINGGRMPDFVRGSAIRDPQITQIGLSLLAEMADGATSGRLFGESLAVALAARLVTCFAKIDIKSPPAEGGMQRWRLKRTLEYINDNLGKDLSLTTLSEVAGLSQYYFCRLFKQSVGMTPHKYIMNQRIERARELLRNSKLSISIISEQIGFADQTHFAVSFRRATQMTPTEFRFRM